MSTRSTRESATKQNELNKLVLTRLLNEEGNKTCADCTERLPRWSSWSLGIFVCLKCSGCHRSLGVHVSKVKSINLDTWTREQVNHVAVRGNKWANEYYLDRHSKGIHFHIKEDDENLLQFIRNKYQHKKYIRQGRAPELNDKTKEINQCELEIFGANNKFKHHRSTNKESKSNSKVNVSVNGSSNNKNSKNKEPTSTFKQTSINSIDRPKSSVPQTNLLDFGDFGEFSTACNPVKVKNVKDQNTTKIQVHGAAHAQTDKNTKNQNNQVQDLFEIDFSQAPVNNSCTNNQPNTNKIESLQTDNLCVTPNQNLTNLVDSEKTQNFTAAPTQTNAIADIMALYKSNPGRSIVNQIQNNSNSTNFQNDLTAFSSINNNSTNNSTISQFGNLNLNSAPKTDFSQVNENQQNMPQTNDPFSNIFSNMQEFKQNNDASANNYFNKQQNLSNNPFKTDLNFESQSSTNNTSNPTKSANVDDKFTHNTTQDTFGGFQDFDTNPFGSSINSSNMNASKSIEFEWK